MSFPAGLSLANLPRKSLVIGNAVVLVMVMVLLPATKGYNINSNWIESYLYRKCSFPHAYLPKMQSLPPSAVQGCHHSENFAHSNLTAQSMRLAETLAPASGCHHQYSWCLSQNNQALGTGELRSSDLCIFQWTLPNKRILPSIFVNHFNLM